MPRHVCTVTELLAGSLRFRTLLTLFVATDLFDDLRGPGRWVVLAPQEEAFDRLPRARLDDLFAHDRIEELVDVAENHVCRYPPSGAPLVTLFGERAPLASRLGAARASRGVVRTHACANGDVLELSRVLLPARQRFERPRTGVHAAPPHWSRAAPANGCDVASAAGHRRAERADE